MIGSWPAFCLGAAAPVVVARVAQNIPPVVEAATPIEDEARS